ncbi:MAG TPA: inorganic diphosphatase [Terriglobales bacterium]|nr:inorganic diphosphatase [Terriglobales bacterium]
MAKHGLKEPTRLATRDDSGLYQVIVETPKACRNKFAYDPHKRIFCLRKVLPAGMAFPYDFGFLPGTLAEDGDPVDVLLLMDEPAYPGVVVQARLIGIIEGEQIEGKKRVRNDRVLAVADATHRYADVKKFTDLPAHFIKELEEFFVNYHRLEGKQYQLLGCHGAATARRLIDQAAA